jgi:predicted PhzF superfamily epimerase YddE/YHI9
MALKHDFGGTTCHLSIRQGVLMGRPSEIEAEARKSGSAVTSVSVGGAAAYIASGEIEVPPSALVSQTA